jgi:hypothetical protein
VDKKIMKKEQHDDWNPKDASILKDQRTAYDEMREKCPVAHSELMGWSLFRHEDITAVLKDPETYSNESRYQAIPNGMDPPKHAKYRKLLDSFFEQEQMTKLEPRTREIAADLLVPMLSGGESEFVSAFATPFALKTLCAMMGWPEHQWECLGGWVHDSQEAAFTVEHAAGKALASLFSEHVKANLNKHRASAHDAVDATSGLLSLNIDNKCLDDDEIVSILRKWTAGQGTVASALSNIVMHLALEPELQDRLRLNPSLIPAAIEEILRVDDSLVANRRTTTQEVEIRGRSIPKGDTLTLMWIAANRDPQAFAEPGVVNLERNMDSSLVWGQGIHLCQGAPLARLEMRVALEELLLRTKRFEFAGIEPNRSVYPSNGFATLQLRFIC